MGIERLFRKEKQEHRILREATQRAGQLVPEYHRPRRSVPIRSAGACMTR